MRALGGASEVVDIDLLVMAIGSWSGSFGKRWVAKVRPDGERRCREMTMVRSWSRPWQLTWMTCWIATLKVKNVYTQRKTRPMWQWV